MKKSLFILAASSALLFSCANDAEEVVSDVEAIPTEIVEELTIEQTLNDEAHELNDEVEEFINEL